MTTTIRVSMLASAALLALGLSAPAQAQQATMTFFVTSAGPGNGGDLGGLAGADAHCARLAQAAGSSGKTWRAYLSTQGAGAVNAKDRIGAGPWQNAKGVVDRQERRRPARRQQQSEQADRAEREGRRDQRPRRHAQPARHPDRLAIGRHRLRRRRRPHLRQLDQQRQGRRHGRPSRPQGAERIRADAVVEFVASLARAGRRLHPGRSARAPAATG